tara:strand:+ start:1675 stop:2628 length:954 start_codon:yes stop_codon:yes gene_type:complete
MAASINEVRNTVLAIANKNNYGYITPQDFNLYAKQAQMDMFEDYFYQYNNWINKENNRTSGTGYANIVKGLVEVIDSFSTQAFLVQANANQFNLPLDYYLINKLFFYSVPLFTGTSAGPAVNQLIDPTAIGWTTIPASAPTPNIGSIVVNTTTFLQAYVTGVVNTTTITISADIFLAAGDTYVIYSNTNIKEVERVSQNKIFQLTSSMLTAPSRTYPAYVLDANTVTVYPSTIMNAGDIQSQYIRYPLDPRWTWQSLVGGEPLFDATAVDFQEFELPDSDEPTLIAKICQYIGIEIREEMVYSFGSSQEQIETQESS